MGGSGSKPAWTAERNADGTPTWDPFYGPPVRFGEGGKAWAPVQPGRPAHEVEAPSSHPVSREPSDALIPTAGGPSTNHNEDEDGQALLTATGRATAPPHAGGPP